MYIKSQGQGAGRPLSFSPNATLVNKVALVTGAARRIGATIVRRLHAGGAAVAIHYHRSAAEARDLRDELNATRANSAEVFPGDLAEQATPESLVAGVVDWAGRLDVLVNNASSFYPTPLGSVTTEQWTDLVATNLKAPLFLAQAAWPQLKEHHGSIINLLDIHAARPLRHHLVYGSAKAGLAMLTRSLAKEMAPEVRVNGVSPGAILWPENGMSDSTQRSILRQIPLGKAGEPEDIAGCVLYLVRDAAYVTGQIIAIDGGRSLGW